LRDFGLEGIATHLTPSAEVGYDTCGFGLICFNEVRALVSRSILNKVRQFLHSRLFRFLLGGGAATLLNLGLIILLIEHLGLETPFLRNAANAIAIELSLIFSFLIYRSWVWTGGEWTLRGLLLKQLPLYHVSTGAVLLARIFLVFPILDWLGIHYIANTFIGILLSATLNYLVNDRLVFKGKNQQQSDLYVPEGLAPAVEYETPAPFHPDRNREIRTLSIVIPAYNEEEGITPTVQRIGKTLQTAKIDYEILVVNDNSGDRTQLVLQTLSEQDSRIRYINNYYPNGFGFAVRCGLENFQGEAVVIVMADSSDPPENIVDYYHKLQEGYDCVFGSRFIKGGRVVDYPAHKLIVNRLANLFIQMMFGLKFNDITNAFKGYRREVVKGISPLLSHHFNLTVEMPLKAIARGYSYTTVPISWYNRATGISKLKLKEMGSRYLFVVLFVWLEKHLSRGDYVRYHEQALLEKR
jgi:dolichol-phosphate mannosyltransferase